MNNRKGSFVLAITVFLMAGLVLHGNVTAQQAEPVAPKKEEPAVNVKVGGDVYAQFSSRVKSAAPIKKSASNGNSFALTRAYLTVKADLGMPELTANVILDAGEVSAATKSSTTVYKSTSAVAFIKNAYVQYSNGWFENDRLGKAFGLTLRGGIIPTPNSNLITGLSDLRWLGNEKALDKSEYLIKRNLDTTADLGASVSFKIFKYAELTYAICNGEGFTQIKETYDGKSHYLMGDITAFMDLHVYGVFKDAGLKGSSGAIAHLQYGGGGIAWKNALIKAGIGFINSVYRETSPHQPRERFNTLEAWFNLNLASVTNYGFLVVGRFAWGNQYDRANHDNMMIVGGFGYEVNKYFRMMAYYEHYMFNKGWTSPISSYTPDKDYAEGTFYIKTEAKF